MTSDSDICCMFDKTEHITNHDQSTTAGVSTDGSGSKEGGQGRGGCGYGAGGAVKVHGSVTVLTSMVCPVMGTFASRQHWHTRRGHAVEHDKSGNMRQQHNIHGQNLV